MKLDIQAMEDDAIECAYWAGIIDGEGSIMMTKQNPPKRLREGHPQYRPIYYGVVSISNTNKELIEQAKQFFGVGYVTLDIRTVWRPNAKPVHHYIAKARNAVVVIDRVLPYLRVKHRQGELVLATQKRITEFNSWRARYRHIPPDENAFREQMYYTLKQLNRRGDISNPRYT